MTVYNARICAIMLTDGEDDDNDDDDECDDDAKMIMTMTEAWPDGAG